MPSVASLACFNFPLTSHSLGSSKARWGRSQYLAVGVVDWLPLGLGLALRTHILEKQRTQKKSRRGLPNFVRKFTVSPDCPEETFFCPIIGPHSDPSPGPHSLQRETGMSLPWPHPSPSQKYDISDGSCGLRRWEESGRRHTEAAEQLTRSDTGRRGDLIAQLAKSDGKEAAGTAGRLSRARPDCCSWWAPPLWPSSPLHRTPPHPFSLSPLPPSPSPPALLPALLPVTAHYIGTK